MITTQMQILKQILARDGEFDTNIENWSPKLKVRTMNNAIYLILLLCYYAIFYAYDLTMYPRYVLVRQQPPKDTLHKIAIVANLSVMIILLFSDINLQKTDMILSSLSRLGCTRLWTKLTIYLKEVRRISERQSMIRSFACWSMTVVSWPCRACLCTRVFACCCL